MEVAKAEVARGKVAKTEVAKAYVAKSESGGGGKVLKKKADSPPPPPPLGLPLHFLCRGRGEGGRKRRRGLFSNSPFLSPPLKSSCMDIMNTSQYILLQ